MQLAIASKEKKAKFSNESSDPLAGPAAVVQTLSRLLQDYDLQSRFADVTLILRRGDSSFVELKTNRCILAAWSDRFRSLLLDVDPLCPRLELLEDDPVAFVDLLRFLYTGCLELKANKVMSLARCSDKYNVAQVTVACCEYMRKNLSADNCVKTLEGTLGLDSPEFTRLHSHCLEYLRGSFWRVVDTITLPPTSSTTLSNPRDDDDEYEEQEHEGASMKAEQVAVVWRLLVRVAANDCRPLAEIASMIRFDQRIVARALGHCALNRNKLLLTDSEVAAAAVMYFRPLPPVRPPVQPVPHLVLVADKGNRALARSLLSPRRKLTSVETSGRGRRSRSLKGGREQPYYQGRVTVFMAEDGFTVVSVLLTSASATTTNHTTNHTASASHLPPASPAIAVIC